MAVAMAEGTKIDWTARPYRLAGFLLEAFERARKKKYVVGRRRNLLEAWQKWCSLKRMPCIIIKPRRHHATVYMDVVLCDFVLSEEHIDPISEAMHEASESIANVVVGLDFCSSNYVFSDKAEVLAATLLKIAEKAHKEGKRTITPQARKHIGRRSKAEGSRQIGSAKSAARRR